MAVAALDPTVAAMHGFLQHSTGTCAAIQYSGVLLVAVGIALLQTHIHQALQQLLFEVCTELCASIQGVPRLTGDCTVDDGGGGLLGRLVTVCTWDLIHSFAHLTFVVGTVGVLLIVCTTVTTHTTLRNFSLPGLCAVTLICKLPLISLILLRQCMLQLDSSKGYGTHQVHATKLPSQERASITVLVLTTVKPCRTWSYLVL